MSGTGSIGTGAGEPSVCVSSGIFPFHSFSVVASAFNSVKCYSRIFLQDNLLLVGHILFPWLSILYFLGFPGGFLDVGLWGMFFGFIFTFQIDSKLDSPCPVVNIL